MQLITPLSPIWFFVKIFFIVGLVVYLIFALVVVRQVQIMTDTVKLQFEFPIKMLSLIHFLLAIGILIFALISL